MTSVRPLPEGISSIFCYVYANIVPFDGTNDACEKDFSIGMGVDSSSAGTTPQLPFCCSYIRRIRPLRLRQIKLDFRGNGL